MQATQTASAAMLRRRCLPTGPGIRLRRIGFGALLRCRTPPLHRPGGPRQKKEGAYVVVTTSVTRPSRRWWSASTTRPLFCPCSACSVFRHLSALLCPGAQEARGPLPLRGLLPQNPFWSHTRELWCFPSMSQSKPRPLDTPWNYCLSASIWIETDLTNRSGLCDSATPPKEAIEATGYALKIHYT